MDDLKFANLFGSEPNGEEEEKKKNKNVLQYEEELVTASAINIRFRPRLKSVNAKAEKTVSFATTTNY